MMAKKRRGFVLPLNPSALLEAIGLTERQAAFPREVAVFVDTSLDPAFLAHAKGEFRMRSDNVLLTIYPYFDEALAVAEGTTVAIVLAEDSPATGRLLTNALRMGVPAAVLALDPVRLQQIARENYNEIDPLSIVLADERADASERFERLFAALGEWVVRKLPEDQLALARAFDFVREPFVESAIQATSLQNGAIAAVVFIPGADMPLLTLNQAKLFMQIAAAYGKSVDVQRLGELIVLALSGFGFRALARRLVGVVPVLGWAIRGGVGYTGTLAIGKAAKEYFEKGGDLQDIMRKITSRRGGGEGPDGEAFDGETSGGEAGGGGALVGGALAGATAAGGAALAGGVGGGEGLS
jgi:uncharacterized protein (DUF697 family)